jgi:UDP-arabinose 4-epimerase
LSFSLAVFGKLDGVASHPEVRRQLDTVHPTSRPEPVSILVAGGAGYIGSHTAKTLVKSGFRPVVLDNFSTGNRWAVRFGPCVEGSTGDRDLVAKTVAEYDIRAAILFAAHAYVGESTVHPARYYRNNVSESLAFVDALLAAGVKRLVFSSSCSIYGLQNQLPISEESATSPLSPYAETKLFLEKVLGWYDSAYGMRSVCLRYFNAAGADPEGDIGECHSPETHLIPLAILAALRGTPLEIFGADYPTPDGTAIRDYIHVSDLASAHVLALHHLLQDGESVRLNCGTGKGHSVKEVVQMVESVSGGNVPIKYSARRVGDAPALVADATRIREAFGWEAEYSSLRTICETAWKWHSRNSPGA